MAALLAVKLFNLDCEFLCFGIAACFFYTGRELYVCNNSIVL